MIDVADSNAVYYYHYNALGSVVALSDSSGDSCQSYEYSVYGQTAVSDPNFIANPYMFTGRRFDYETGLYYYRARYYNPYIGRFLQTDPIGYSAGMNMYAYCKNNPLCLTDPSGNDPCNPCDHNNPCDESDWKSFFYSHVFPADAFNMSTTTGKVMVLPGLLGNPDSFADMCDIARIGTSDITKFIFDVLQTAPFSGGKYTEGVQNFFDELQGIARQSSTSGMYGWKAYIQIQAYEFKKVGIFDRRYEWVKKGKPSWVEVRGFRGWKDPLGSWGDTREYSGYTDKFQGYFSEKDAFNAAYNASGAYSARCWAPDVYVSPYWLQKEKEGWCPTHGHICN